MSRFLNALECGQVGTIKLVTKIPGPGSLALTARIEESVARGISHATPIAVAWANGAAITDIDGNTFIDFAGGIGAMNSGHGAGPIVDGVRQQAKRYLHLCFMVTAYEPYVQLAEKLNAITPGPGPKKTVLFNSGAEAVENAVKIARLYTRRPRIVSFTQSFHGRTLLALSLTGQVYPYKAGMGPFLPNVYHLPYPHTYRCHDCLGTVCGKHSPDSIRELFASLVAADTIAAVIIEPVAGEGGFLVPPLGYLEDLKRICEEHGILLIADEVQTGFGRTGRMFAIEHVGVEPDLIVTAKSLSGGLPLSAVTGRAEVMDAGEPGTLGGTYGGNPLSCVAALAAIDVIERDRLVARAAGIGERIRQRFIDWYQRFPIVGDVRGLGAMMAIELVADRSTKEPAAKQTAQVIKRCYENGLILLKAGAEGNVLRTLMPLMIEDDQLAEGLDVIENALVHVSRA